MRAGYIRLQTHTFNMQYLLLLKGNYYPNAAPCYFYMNIARLMLFLHWYVMLSVAWCRIGNCRSVAGVSDRERSAWNTNNMRQGPRNPDKANWLLVKSGVAVRCNQRERRCFQCAPPSRLIHLLEMQVFSVETQLYYLTNQLHVSAALSKPSTGRSRDIRKEGYSTVAILVGNLGPYKYAISTV